MIGMKRGLNEPSVYHRIVSQLSLYSKTTAFVSDICIEHSGVKDIDDKFKKNFLGACGRVHMSPLT